MHFGRTFRLIQLNKNIPTQDIAAKLGVTPQQVYRWYKAPDVKLSLLTKIAEVLDVEPQELFEDTLN